jgi:hypothetical protein
VHYAVSSQLHAIAYDMLVCDTPEIELQSRAQQTANAAAARCDLLTAELDALAGNTCHMPLNFS